MPPCGHRPGHRSRHRSGHRSGWADVCNAPCRPRCSAHRPGSAGRRPRHRQRPWPIDAGRTHAAPGDPTGAAPARSGGCGPVLSRPLQSRGVPASPMPPAAGPEGARTPVAGRVAPEMPPGRPCNASALSPDGNRQRYGAAERQWRTLSPKAGQPPEPARAPHRQRRHGRPRALAHRHRLPSQSPTGTPEPPSRRWQRLDPSAPPPGSGTETASPGPAPVRRTTSPPAPPSQGAMCFRLVGKSAPAPPPGSGRETASPGPAPARRTASPPPPSRGATRFRPVGGFAPAPLVRAGVAPAEVGAAGPGSSPRRKASAVRAIPAIARPPPIPADATVRRIGAARGLPPMTLVSLRRHRPPAPGGGPRRCRIGVRAGAECRREADSAARWTRWRGHTRMARTTPKSRVVRRVHSTPPPNHGPRGPGEIARPDTDRPAGLTLAPDGDATPGTTRLRAPPGQSETCHAPGDPRRRAANADRAGRPAGGARVAGRAMPGRRRRSLTLPWQRPAAPCT